MNVLIDGVFFQLANTGIARVWRSVLPQLAKLPDLTITMLDRGNCPDIDGIRKAQFPSYKDKHNTADSQLIQRMCAEFSADVFISTYYTTPLTTPSVAVLYDMIPERMGFELDMRAWQEKELCIAHARRHLCISGQTRADLLEFYPELDPANVLVAPCGVDSLVFQPRSAAEQAAFRTRHGLRRPYLLVVGSRTQNKGYKNTKLLFQALSTLPDFDRDILCVGGEPELEDWIVEMTPAHVSIRQAELSDIELSVAYSGAEALVYPSLYEGFGMPVIEAMACGCPVITTALGSLAEVAGPAALLIDGYSVGAMRDALIAVQAENISAQLSERGLSHAKLFRWSAFSQALASAIRVVVGEASSGRYEQFYGRWSALRTLQGDVDALI